MNITIIQPETLWENKAGNLLKIGKLIQKHYRKTDIIVLPEMFTTGFTLNAGPLSEDLNGETARWMADQALKGDFAVCGSIIVHSGDKYYNHFLFVTPQNGSFSYRKRHLFNLGGENEIYAPGNRREIIDFRGFRFLPLICYDLRFPVWSRNRDDYDVIICVASWPDARRDAWNSLLKARAIENQCYVAAVNNTGKDLKNYNYAGDSVILDPLGKTLANVNEYQEGDATAEISLTELMKIRTKLPFLKDADSFTLNY
jgi:omega-amidase